MFVSLVFLFVVVMLDSYLFLLMLWYGNSVLLL